MPRSTAACAAWVDYVAGRAGDDGLWDGRLPVRRLARPDRPARRTRSCPDRREPAWPPPTSRGRHGCSRGRPQCSGATDDRRRTRRSPTRSPRRFAQAYVEPSGRLSSDSQTAYCACARTSTCWPAQNARRLAGAPTRRARARKRLPHRDRLRRHAAHLRRAREHGYLDDAYKLLLQRECPSWLYPVTMGATTIWERWDSLLPDGSLNSGRHDVASTTTRSARSPTGCTGSSAGLAPAEPGYRRLLIRPRPGGGLTHANAQHLTPYGLAEAGWRIEEGELEVRAVVPARNNCDCRPSRRHRGDRRRARNAQLGRRNTEPAARLSGSRRPSALSSVALRSSARRDAARPAESAA